jgi:hypothetical protein
MNQLLAHLPAVLPQSQPDSAMTITLLTGDEYCADGHFELAMTIWRIELGLVIVIGRPCQPCRIQQVGKVMVGLEGGNRLDL